MSIRKVPSKKKPAKKPAPEAPPVAIPLRDRSWFALMSARIEMERAADTCEVIAASLPPLGTPGGTLALTAAAKLLRGQARSLLSSAFDVSDRVATLDAEYQAKHGAKGGDHA